MNSQDLKKKIGAAVEKSFENVSFWSKINFVILVVLFASLLLLYFYKVNLWAIFLITFIVLANFAMSFAKNNFLKEASTFMCALFLVSSAIVSVFSVIILLFFIF